MGQMKLEDPRIWIDSPEEKGSGFSKVRQRLPCLSLCLFVCLIDLTFRSRNGWFSFHDSVLVLALSPPRPALTALISLLRRPRLQYVDYALCQPSKSVRHRYSDFEKLHSTLSARYATYGVLVPSLPKKNVMLKGAGFHFQRMRGLQMFCENVARNPYLRDDPAWTDFLEEGRALVVEKEGVPPPPPRWMQAIDSNVTPSNSGEIINACKVESTRAEKNFADLIAKAKSLIGEKRGERGMRGGREKERCFVSFRFF